MVALAGAMSGACAGRQQPPPEQAEAPRDVTPRYRASVPVPEAPETDVEPAALAGAKRFLVRELADTGGVPAERGAGLPGYVFQATVRDMQPDASGRTRASVELVVSTQRGGKIVGMLRATATAYVERSEPLSTRQLEAIEGALDGALQRLPQLLDSLERERATRPRRASPAM